VASCNTAPNVIGVVNFNNLRAHFLDLILDPGSRLNRESQQGTKVISCVREAFTRPCGVPCTLSDKPSDKTPVFNNCAINLVSLPSVKLGKTCKDILSGRNRRCYCSYAPMLIVVPGSRGLPEKSSAPTSGHPQ